jgi:hypothetical protein
MGFIGHLYTPLGTTLYRTLTHTDWCPKSIRISTNRFLATASRERDSSAFRTEVLLPQPPVQNSCQLPTLNKVGPRLAAISHQPPSLPFTGWLSTELTTELSLTNQLLHVTSLNWTADKWLGPRLAAISHQPPSLLFTGWFSTELTTELSLTNQLLHVSSLNWTADNSQLSTNSLFQTVLLIISRHGPHRKHRFHCYSPTISLPLHRNGCLLIRLLRSNGFSLQSHLLATGLYATIFSSFSREVNSVDLHVYTVLFQELQSWLSKIILPCLSDNIFIQLSNF